MYVRACPVYRSYGMERARMVLVEEPFRMILDRMGDLQLTCGAERSRDGVVFVFRRRRTYLEATKLF